MPGQLASDPSYLAYMRALGFEEAEAVSSAQRGRDRLGRQQALAIPELEYQGGLAREGIEGAMEDRGMFRSGLHEKEQAKAAHEVGYKRSQLDLAYGEGLGEIEANLARQLANIGQRRGEQQLQTGGGQYLNRGLIPYGGGGGLPS